MREGTPAKPSIYLQKEKYTARYTYNQCVELGGRGRGDIDKQVILFNKDNTNGVSRDVIDIFSHDLRSNLRL